VQYLEEIETTADPTEIALAKDVYGEPEPFLSIFDDPRSE
jgi:hypothetical protein